MDALIQVLILFSLIGVGYLCKKLKIISNNMNNDISSLLVYVSLPALIIVSISSFVFSDTLFEVGAKLLVISFGLNFVYIVFSYLFTKFLGVEGTTKDVFQFALIFPNSGFIGFPIAYVVFGEIGVFYMAIVNMMSDVFLWTFGVRLLQRSSITSMKPSKGTHHVSLLSQMMNPCIVAVFIGFGLFLTSTKLPLVIYNSLDLLGSITTPLSMIFIGSMLGDLKVNQIFNDVKIILCCFIRLLILPFIIWGILKLFNLDEMLLQILVIATALPVAVGMSIVAAKYENDHYLASKVVFISTLFSIVTIPFFIWIL
ncbi:hypothetical protein SAMN05660297_02665 [Natronincola peptidivorans]|uniref:AEC family transporter n=1 Tax=Natronincola peptidivorans TaxID=426128 RepID=A0A1I0F3M4_9FIRM|nr:AEC family transporter [Natronincola peptidivorans]SET52427.1 hypothetical protein SAMN05660297_02665 [Natronincola peptidivorans]